MKIASIVLPLLFSVNLFAKTSIVDGVPMNCVDKADARVAKSKELSLVAICRSRSNPTQEYYTYCGGSGCKGFTAIFKNNQCRLTDFWHGQDDQDMVDPVEWQKNCLVSADFSTIP